MVHVEPLSTVRSQSAPTGTYSAPLCPRCRLQAHKSDMGSTVHLHSLLHPSREERGSRKLMEKSKRAGHASIMKCAEKLP